MLKKLKSLLGIALLSLTLLYSTVPVLADVVYECGKTEHTHSEVGGDCYTWIPDTSAAQTKTGSGRPSSVSLPENTISASFSLNSWADKGKCCDGNGAGTAAYTTYYVKTQNFDKDNHVISMTYGSTYHAASGGPCWKCGTQYANVNTGDSWKVTYRVALTTGHWELTCTQEEHTHTYECTPIRINGNLYARSKKVNNMQKEVHKENKKLPNESRAFNACFV